jgi:hypothetical protein
MAERVIIWLIFGFALSMAPLMIVAFMGWMPASGVSGFIRFISNEDLLAVALTLGGAAAADVLTKSAGALRLLKLLVGGLTSLASVFSVAGSVAIKAHANHLDNDQITTLVEIAGGATLIGALFSEVLSEL